MVLGSAGGSFTLGGRPRGRLGPMTADFALGVVVDFLGLPGLRFSVGCWVTCGAVCGAVCGSVCGTVCGAVCVVCGAGCGGDWGYGLKVILGDEGGGGAEMDVCCIGT